VNIRSTTLRVRVCLCLCPCIVRVFLGSTVLICGSFISWRQLSCCRGNSCCSAVSRAGGNYIPRHGLSTRTSMVRTNRSIVNDDLDSSFFPQTFSVIDAVHVHTSIAGMHSHEHLIQHGIGAFLHSLLRLPLLCRDS
jgi:hypothetical protein